MTTLESCSSYANDLLEDHGFSSRTLSDFDLPETQTVEVPEGGVNFTVHGSLEAPNKILEAAPYLTDLSSPHFKMRLNTQQEVLGDEFCIIGVQAYAPDQKFSARDELKFFRGSFERLSERELRVAEALGIEAAALYGHSLAGDVAIQTGHDALKNPSRGVMEVLGVGAVDYARSSNRGPFVALAMGSSGGRFLGNILASDSPALNSHWGVSEEMSEEDKNIFDKKTMQGVKEYWLGNVLANLGMTFGFGTAKSNRQLEYILDSSNVPVLVGRESESKLIPQKVGEWLKTTRANYIEEANDHSADDNIRGSAARILYFTRAAFLD